MHVLSTPEGFVDVLTEGSKGTHVESFKGKTPHDIKHFGERRCWEILALSLEGNTRLSLVITTQDPST